jgi:Protein of unknown function (DUF3168)
MEVLLRAALIAWLAADAALSAQLNSVTEEVPSRASLPWLGIATSASADWSNKSHVGREVRVALELHCRGDLPDTAADLVTAIEQSIAALPSAQPTYDIVTIQFVRARAEQRPANTRAILLEYRFRLMAH